MITRPVRERPADQVRTMIAEGLRRTGYDEVSLDVAVDGRLQRHRAGRRRHPRRSRGEQPGLRSTDDQPAVAARRRVHRRARRPGQQRAPQRADVRARGRLVAAAPGDQQADHRGGPLRRRRRRRSPRAGRGSSCTSSSGCRPRPTRTRSASPSWPATASSSVERHSSRASVTAASAASCPSRTRRSSGSGRTPAPSCSARSTCCATRPAERARRQPQVARPGGDAWPRASSAAATAASAASSSGSGVTAARSRSGASTSTCAAGPTPWRPRACRSTGTCTATATEAEVLPWAHLTAGLHEDFLWDDWQAALAAGRASRTAAGRRATTAACAPATASSTSSPRPSPPAGGSQGTGQDLHDGGEVPVALSARCWRRRP